jgi:hypothetical protein
LKVKIPRINFSSFITKMHLTGFHVA